jgi:hypothetical protein
MKQVTEELGNTGINKKQATFSKNWSKIYSLYVTSANSGVRPMLEDYFPVDMVDREAKVARLHRALDTVYRADCEVGSSGGYLMDWVFLWVEVLTMLTWIGKWRGPELPEWPALSLLTLAR